MDRRLLKLMVGAVLAIAASVAACQAAASEWTAPAGNAIRGTAPEPIRDANEASRFAAHALAERSEAVRGGGATVFAQLPGGLPASCGSVQ